MKAESGATLAEKIEPVGLPPAPQPTPATAPAPAAPGRSVAPVETALAEAPATEPVAAWERVCVKLRQQPSLASLADDLRLTELAAGVAIVSAPTNTKANYARTRQSTLAEILSEVTGSRIRVEVRLAQSASARAARGPAPSSVAQAEAAKDPLVRRAMELFDARVVDVSDDPKGGGAGPGGARSEAGEDGGIED